MAEGTYLTTTFRDKDKVKALGARWDPDQKAWYAPAGADLARFRQWLPVGFESTGELVPSTAEAGTDRAAVIPKGVTLSQLLGGVAQAVAEAYSTGVWTMVEVVDARVKGGHVYLEVAERTAIGDVTAKGLATIWAMTAARILPEFERATGAKIGPGIKLLLKLKPVFAARYGLSLQVDAIDPDYTLGDLEAKKREIRQRLLREGIFELNKKFPQVWDYNAVLVIAPEGAAGLGDFKAEAMRLETVGICRFIYVHSRFQGEGAAAGIRIALLKALDECSELPDAVAIIRGGGAVNDLAWLNDYELARCICEAPLPVLTGIGHERDSTVLDEVAHTRFDTPSKVIHGIETVIRQRAKEARQFYEATTAMAQQATQRCRLTSESAHAHVKEAARHQLATAHHQIEANLGELRVGAMKAIRSAADESRTAFASIELEARQQVAHARQTLPGLIENIKAEARATLKDARAHSEDALRKTIERTAVVATGVREQTNRAMTDIAVNARRALRDATANTGALVREIAGQGPEKTLGRGFAMVRDEGGETITSATDSHPGQRIEIQFRDGSVKAVIEGRSTP